jgi:hypothetical protein
MSIREKSGSGVSGARRVWPAVMVGVGSLMLLAVVRFLLPEPALTLEYLKVIVWPTVIGLILWSVRDLLRDKFAQLLKIGAFGAEAEFAATERLQENVTGPAAAVFADTVAPDAQHNDGETEVDQGLTDPAIGDDVNVETQPTERSEEGILIGLNPVRNFTTMTKGDAARDLGGLSANQRRAKRVQEQQAIERIIKESAVWGYDMARLGKGRPVPAIEWTEDGRPIIKYGQADVPVAFTTNWDALMDEALPPKPLLHDDLVKRLEAEIRALETKIDNRPYATGLALGPDGERERLRKLKSRLRQIDPNSALAYED